MRLGIGATDSPLAMELYLRIEGARFAAQALRLRPMGAFTELTGPEWRESRPPRTLEEPSR